MEAARHALAGGDNEAALRLLAQRQDPDALHLRALAQRRGGRLAEARATFAAARAAAPEDPEIANNYANLLAQLGAHEEALQLYDRALALHPRYRDAAFNKALLLARLGESAPALALLAEIVAQNPRDAPAQSARGTILRGLGRLDAAAAAYEAGLAAHGGLVTALKGRAQIALERGEDDAVDRFRRALRAAPGDPDLVHGYAEALEAAGGGEATGVLERVLETHPEWIAGQLLLARMKAERGDTDYTGGMRAAIAQRPDDRDLALAHAGTLAAGERWSEALSVLPPGDDAELATVKAHYLCEAGHAAEALSAIAVVGCATANAAVIAARAHFRLGQPDKAAALLERAVDNEPGAMGAWGHLELAWRVLGDPRSAWLSGQDGLVATCDIGIGEGELSQIAALLRRLHRTRAHPLGQSLRGGTQTRGALFARTEPALARLRDALMAAVARYREALPPADAAHPLLRHRDSDLRMSGSWSVRLTDAGYHISHIHSEGLISSACYLALPDPCADDTRAGWLELGRPPAELGFDLEPLAMIEPRVGRLALFPSFLFHGTRPFPAGERLSVAFDVTAA
ncbi:putative 2OG-Fe(II) oxygenase [Qipengyuania sediminis]|uniref:putative 2OG-Fe(II) oxygenase n=1 Tax=Qipengyuania sediminis TaxID=1532023 RepID=UPI00197D056E|nr:putative 2OG-Fe(II) oxygenase [Qipengyuania sediminis]